MPIPDPTFDPPLLHAQLALDATLCNVTIASALSDEEVHQWIDSEQLWPTDMLEWKFQCALQTPYELYRTILRTFSFLAGFVYHQLGDLDSIDWPRVPMPPKETAFLFKRPTDWLAQLPRRPLDCPATNTRSATKKRTLQAAAVESDS